MEEAALINKKREIPVFLSGGGAIGQRILEYPWAETSLGSFDRWPQSLRAAVSICLNSNFPIAIYWGPDLVLLYNEAWSPIPGEKHPWALGKPAKTVWPEIWDAIEPQFQKAFNGEAGGSKRAFLPMERHGYKEECYFDFTFTPIYGEDGKVKGVFNAVIETTQNVLNERQLQTLTNLGKALISSRTASEVIESTFSVLRENPYDFPFALFRSIANGKAVLAQSTDDIRGDLGAREVDIRGDLGKKEVDLSADTSANQSAEDEIAASMEAAISSREVQVVDNLGSKIGDVPTGAWSVPADKLLTVSVAQAGKTEPYGILQIGLNPHRKLDESYASFFHLIADQMAAAFSQVHYAEEERKRAAALAAIDKAKTAFFTNISHEFRTPLTLMLGTMEDALNDPDTTVRTTERLAVGHRNAMRLLKLVNSLLDFSRLEAGRLKASFQLTDIGLFTKRIASNFRSSIEKAGLQFVIQSNAFIQPVYLDRDMWEKIVNNLLSNAFKYTLKGRIEVSLSVSESGVQLVVKDTGVGIPAEEMANLFQRFHRVNNNAGRTFEGSGIGLSLVKELVEMHAGTISVSSREGVGSEFAVTIPTGRSHLQPNQIEEKPLELEDAITTAFIEEAESTIVTEESDTQLPIQAGLDTVLIVDDNPDMREYLRSILRNRFNVISATNGMNALHQLTEGNIAVVVSDIMMPIMDGVQLVRHIRQTPAISGTPVILLSARAGEEAKVEGLDIGADDYLTKPFAARELLARIRSQISLTKLRKQVESEVSSMKEQLEVTIQNIPSSVYLLDRNGRFLYVNRPGMDTIRRVLGSAYDERDDLRTMMAKARNRAQFFDNEGQLVGLDSSSTLEELTAGVDRERMMKRVILETGEVTWLANRTTPVLDSDGKIKFIVITNTDITAQKIAEDEIRSGNERLQAALDASQTGTFRWNIRTNELQWDDNLDRLFGLKPGQEVRALDKFIEKVHPDDRQAVIDACAECATKGADFDMEYRVVFPDKSIRWLYDKGKTHFDESGRPEYMTGACVDVTSYKLAAERIKASEERFEAAVNAVQGILWTTNEKGEMEGEQPGWSSLTGQQYEDYQGNGWTSAIHPDDVRPTLTAWEESVRTHIPFMVEHRVRRKDGSWGQYSVRAIPAYRDDGSILEWVGLHTDVTRERDAEEATRQSEEKFRTLVESLPNLVWMTDADGKMEYASSRWNKYSGLNPADGHTWEKMVHPEDIGRVMATWSSCLSTAAPYREEVRLRNDRGEYRWHFVQGMAVRDVNGQIIKWIGAFSDIHDRKTLMEQLEGLVTERTIELQRSNADLLQFAHVASHDLKEPVRKIRTFALRLKDEFAYVTSEKGKSYIGKIEAAALRMYAMIEGVLLYSSIDSVSETPTSVSLTDVMRQIEGDLEIMIKEKKAKLQYYSLPVVAGFPVLIHQLFYNLISNSLKFSKRDVAPVIALWGAPVTAADLASHDLPSDNKYRKVILKDNGIGFSQADSERLFEPFSRLHSKDKYEGTGLGLSLCRKIVRRHGGVINAFGSDGDGASFEIILPEE